MVNVLKGTIGAKSSAEQILQQYTPTGFTSPGLIGTYTRGNFGVERTAAGQGLIDNLTRLGGEFGSLRSDVRPGFGRLTQSRVTAIRQGRQQAVGDLRAMLARRRVQGSSFANDAVTRANLAFTQEEEKARAESFLGELGLTNDLITRELGTVLEGIKQQNFETGIAAGLTENIQRLLAANQTAQAEARWAQEATATEFWSDVIGAIAGSA